MELRIKKIIELNKRAMKDFGNIEKAIAKYDRQTTALYRSRFLRPIKNIYGDKEIQVKQMKIDFSNIYPKKYSILFRVNKVKSLDMFIDRVLKESSKYGFDDDKPNGLYLAIYLMMLWHMGLIILSKPIISLKLRGLWKDFMTNDTLNLEKATLDKFRLLADLSDKNFELILNAEIDDRDLEVIGGGVKRILKSISKEFWS